MVEIGKMNKLRITKEVDFGLYLDGEEYGEILLPKRYVPQEYEIGADIEVFLYLDSEDLNIATTLKPYAVVGEIVCLKVVAVNKIGAFMDWGLMKDLLVPFSEQKDEMQEGKSYVVKVLRDEASFRLLASSKLDKFLKFENENFEVGEEVDLMIWDRTDLGYNAIINGIYKGLLFENEIFQSLKPGKKIKGFIKNIRDDKRIDLSLQQPGYERISGIAEVIMKKLDQNSGYIPVSDKSKPEVIYEMFSISKKAYKKALGQLYKERLIIFVDNGIKSNK